MNTSTSGLPSAAAGVSVDLAAATRVVRVAWTRVASHEMWEDEARTLIRKVEETLRVDVLPASEQRAGRLNRGSQEWSLFATAISRARHCLDDQTWTKPAAHLHHLVICAVQLLHQMDVPV
ncbi:hypothetical protein [Streptomyces sp. x-80]|uniref:hypothetical protein n=1 Tax=Streptomyces sp. x-80 TaxID=2789282 RepID=UPI0039818266